MDSRRLPLNAVRAFEAAARHLSLSRAAAELGVTPGAIGHQLRLLGAHLGTPLFRKAGTGVALTEAGQRALPKVQEAFAALAGAFDGGAAERALRQVSLGVHASFAAAWLVPRLEAFAARHPTLDVRVLGPVAPESFVASGLDLAITYQATPARGLVLRPLLAETMVAVCSPALLAGRAPLRPDAVPGLPLLHVERADDDLVYPLWDEWLAAAGVAPGGRLRGPRFNLAFMALQAARDGLGLALLSATLVREDLAAGRLVAPLPAGPRLGIQRTLLSRRSPEQRLAVRAFTRWLVAAAKAG